MAMLAITTSTFSLAAAGNANPAIFCSHSADRLCLLSALVKPFRKQRYLSEPYMLYVPASRILKKVRWQEACKTGHIMRKIFPRTGSFCQHVTSESQDGDVNFFDFPQDKRLQSSGKFLLTTVILATGMLQAAEISYAEELTRYSPEQWGRIWITTGVILVLYFLVVPLIIYNFLRLRWYTRSLPETIFQFMLVFVFFPGMLLLAPFINFRPLPKGSKKGP